MIVTWLLLTGCSKETGNPAPPRIESALELPKPASTIIVPLSVDIGMIEARLNEATPKRLWSIDQFERKCVPAQRLSVCAKHVRKCKGDACKNVPCKIGFKRAKVTPDVACRVVGQVTRGRIGISGRRDALYLTMPVTAVVSARDVGGVIKKETATGSATVRATVRLSVNQAWAPVAKVDIDYAWREPPGINFLGQRIKFASKADAKLKGVIAGLERDLSREISRVHTKSLVNAAWDEGFTSILLNRENPPAWMRLTPKDLGFGGYRISGRQLEMTLAAHAVTETFIGDRPPNPDKAPLPPPAKIGGERGLNFYIPVLADYAQLEPVIQRALVRLAAKGISLQGIGPVNVKFGKVTVYATEGGKLAVGINANADVVRSPLEGTNGEIWLTATPYNEPNSQIVKVRDLKIAGRTDREAVNLLFSLFADDEVLAEISKALTQDFKKDYDKVIAAATKAIATRREGDFTLAAQITDVSHGLVTPTGQGLFLPVQVKGIANIKYTPRR
jgi:hypothetical protein